MAKSTSSLLFAILSLCLTSSSFATSIKLAKTTDDMGPAQVAYADCANTGGPINALGGHVFGTASPLALSATSPNCLASVNVAMAVDGSASINMLGAVSNWTMARPARLTLQTSYGATIVHEPSFSQDDLIIPKACDYQGQALKLLVETNEGACWIEVTLKQGNGPVFSRGRSFPVFCMDPLVEGGDILGIKPMAGVPCVGLVDVHTVGDWIHTFPCESDTAKIILREYEAFDKEGRRASLTDTIVVLRLPQIFPLQASANITNISCPERDTLYCGINDNTDRTTSVTPVGPYLLVEELPGFGGLDADGDGVSCDTIFFCGFKDGKFLDLFTGGQKCGLQVHKDVWEFGDVCEKSYKVRLDIKQSCYKDPEILDCTAAGFGNMQILGTGYFRCEFWVTDLDTVPPLFAPKIFQEFECLAVDTMGVGGGLENVLLDIFRPVIFTDEHACEAYTYLPPLCVFDDWSGIKAAKATVEGGGTYLLENEDETCFLFEFGDDGPTFEVGEFAALFGVDLDETLSDSIIELLDTLGLLNAGRCYRSHERVKLPKTDGPIRIFYEVYDSCHLVSRDTVLMLVKDNVRPVVVADKGVTVTLSDKKAWVDAATFDEGSWDNCEVNFVMARRADWTDACVDLCYNAPDDGACEEKESALCWIWTDGHDTLWMPSLEDDKHCDEVEAHYSKQLDWLCTDDQECGALIYNAWLYDLIKYATLDCKPNAHLDDHAFDKLFHRAVGDPQEGDQIRIKNQDVLNFLDTGHVVFDRQLMVDNIVELDSSNIFSTIYGVDVFKCQPFSSFACGGLGSSFEDLFLQIFLQIFLEECVSFFGLAFGLDVDVFLPRLYPDDFKRELFDEWKAIGGGWSDAVPFSCEDACGPVTVEILVMDYWCNWSTAWTKVWVEDKTPVEVVKDVVEEEHITCKIYKDSRYAYPNEIHPVSLEYIVGQAKDGEQDAYDALDEIFGGYCKAWRDPYGNYVDSEGTEIDCDITFYDSICKCTSYYDQVRVYDEHLGYLWVDSLVTKCDYYQDTIDFQKGVVVVNCEENVCCEQDVWCEIDHCGQGYIFRKFKIWQGCPDEFYDEHGIADSLRHTVDTIYRHQRIWVGNECELSKYMFDVPYDTEVVTCDIEYGPDGNVIGAAGPEYTGYATYKFDDDCRIVGIGHSDKVFKIVGGEAACYKILRTWYFADWCGYGEPLESQWWRNNELVTDTCVQKIIVRDTTPPTCQIIGPVEDGGAIEVGACYFDLEASVVGMDACGVIKYYWDLKEIKDGDDATIVDSDHGALSGDTTEGFDISSADLPHGSYKLVVTIQDDCANENYCEYYFDVVSVKKPSPVCISSLTARLTPWDSDQDGVVDSAHAIVWAEEFNSSSSEACTDTALEYRVELIDGINDDTWQEDTSYLEVFCDDFGSHMARLWVISWPSGTVDFCDVVLIVQSDFSGCATSVSGEPSPISQVNDMHDVVGQPQRQGIGQPTQPGIGGRPLGQGIAPNGYLLEQNRPNPFREETTIGFVLPEAMTATLTVYDVTGRVLRSIKGDYAKGYQTVQLLKQNLAGHAILYYRLDAKDFTATKKMILVN